MKSEDLNAIWIEIESQRKDHKGYLQRMVYPDLLYRAFIGSTGIPFKRFLSIEIPEKEGAQFDSFTAPQGFTLTIGDPSVKHKGYVACILTAAASDQNDVFSILTKDILEELRRQKDADLYIESLKKRIEKWRVFFKNPAKNKLSEKTVIGLIGELNFIKDLHSSGINEGVDYWNGPIKAAQDFQGDAIAVEVKTTATNKLEYVHISSEVQLDDDQRDALFLATYRIVRNDAGGTTLPVLIQQVATMISESQKASFYAKLFCLGYKEEDANLYDKGYSVKELKVYKVSDGFPRILRPDLPQGVMDVSYKLSLQSCASFESDFDAIVNSVKEYEYGES